MPIVTDLAEQLAKRDKFFIVFFLSKLRPEYENTLRQILGGDKTPRVDDIFRRLLQISSGTSYRNTTYVIAGHSTLASHSSSKGGHGHRSGNRPHLHTIISYDTLESFVGLSMGNHHLPQQCLL